MAPIFLAGNTRPNPENLSPVAQVTRRVLHQAIGISDNSSDSQPESDIISWQPTLLNSDDEIGNDPEAAADAELSENDIENTANEEGELEGNLRDGRRIIRSDIHSQIKVVHVNGCEYLQCKHCIKKYKRTAGTKNVRDHLLHHHGWTGLTSIQVKRKREHEDITNIINRMGPADIKRRKAIRIQLLSENLDKDTLEHIFIRTLVLSDLPFNLVENNDFRTFLEYINPTANEILPDSHSTICSRIMSLYEEGKRRICLVLQDALSSIHISCDGWTSPNGLGIMGVVGHFTNEDGNLQASLLSLLEIQGAHTGEQLATEIFQVLDSYHIKDRLGYFMMDNATANDRMVTCISDKQFSSDGMEYDSKQHRLRCNGHIINLSVQAFLFGEQREEAEGEDRERREELPSVEELRMWRRIGPMGKLHNIVVYIKSSPQRTQVFRNISGGRMVRQDNGTR